MPSVSKSQQKLMGMVHAYNKGELKLSDLPAELADKIKEMANTLTKKAAKDFASTKHKGLPEVKESITFKEFLLEGKDDIESSAKKAAKDFYGSKLKGYPKNPYEVGTQAYYAWKVVFDKEESAIEKDIHDDYIARDYGNE